MRSPVRFVLALFLPGCLAVPPVRAPEASPPPPAAKPVPIPAKSTDPEQGRLAQCPFFEGKGQGCTAGMGQVCTRDDKGCERCECKPSPGTEAQTVDPRDQF